MKIAILGSGAMGMLFGALLSQHNDVVLVDVDQARVSAVNEEGITVMEPDGQTGVFHPSAVADSSGMQPADLVILFVKAFYSRDALGANRSLMGPNTYVLTLQNGSGHENILREFVDQFYMFL